MDRRKLGGKIRLRTLRRRMAESEALPADTERKQEVQDEREVTSWAEC